MMKRVNLSRFSPLEVSRKVQQCLRLEGVHTNGVALVSDSSEVASERGSRECLSDARPKKGDLLSTLKKKLRRGRRGKASRSRSDSGSGENCDKSKRTRKPKPQQQVADKGTVLRSHNPPDEEEEVESATPCVGNLTQELYKLSKYGWYWGPINRSEAESKLIDQPDGAFLVRDSSDDRYILSLSFRSYGKTLHTRIEHSGGVFSFYSQPEPEGHASVVELIQQSMCYSQSGAFCYSRSRAVGSPSFPVRLTKAVSRFNQVRSLQYLCRFVIRQFTRYDHIQRLPLPPRIRGYLEEGHY